MQENKRLKKYPLTLNGINAWSWSGSIHAFGKGGWGGWALYICRVFGLQMIFETRRTSMVTHFMSTVRANNFCPIDQTIWQCFESEFVIHKSFHKFHFLWLSLFSPPCFSWTPTLLLLRLIPFFIFLPPSGSRLQVPSTAVNQTKRISFFFNTKLIITVINVLTLTALEITHTVLKLQREVSEQD